MREDLVAVTGDGAPIMIKFGRLIGIPYLLCMNHTIHLAVLDKIFTLNINDCEINENGSSEEDQESEEHEDSDDDNENDKLNHQLNHNYSQSLKKMMDIIKLFRYSPLKTSIFEEIQQKEGKQVLKFVVPVRTRWNSTVESGKRFLALLPMTLKALMHKEIKSNIKWTDDDTATLSEVCDVLEPARVATVNLSKAHINLLEGEGILKFLINEIDEQKRIHSGSLATKFADALRMRFGDRRDKSFQTLILYLSNPESLKLQHPLPLSSKTQVIKYGIEMMRRLYPIDNDEPQVLPTANLPESSSLQEKLEKSVGSVRDSQSSQPQESFDRFKKEFDYFDRHHLHGPLLTKFFKAILSAQPTSTQSERKFSLAANIVTKKRSKM